MICRPHRHFRPYIPQNWDVPVLDISDKGRTRGHTLCIWSLLVDLNGIVPLSSTTGLACMPSFWFYSHVYHDIRLQRIGNLLICVQINKDEPFS